MLYRTYSKSLVGRKDTNISLGKVFLNLEYYEDSSTGLTHFTAFADFFTWNHDNDDVEKKYWNWPALDGSVIKSFTVDSNGKVNELKETVELNRTPKALPKAPKDYNPNPWPPK